MLINLSNHPSTLWSNKQLLAAKGYGKIQDIPFPIVNPEDSNEDILNLANHYAKEIISYTNNAKITVHIMGEMTFTYKLVSQLKAQGIVCIASTTDRDAEIAFDGKKISDFHFVRFREY